MGLWPDLARDLDRNNPSLIADGVYGFHPFHFGKAYQSFPSGHAAAAFAVISILWLSRPRWRWLYAAVGGFVCVALVGLNYHFVGDVIAGAMLGSVTGVYATRLFGLRPAVRARSGRRRQAWLRVIDATGVVKIHIINKKHAARISRKHSQRQFVGIVGLRREGATHRHYPLGQPLRANAFPDQDHRKIGRICQVAVSTTSRPRIQAGIFISVPSNNSWQCGQKLMPLSFRGPSAAGNGPRPLVQLFSASSARQFVW